MAFHFSANQFENAYRPIGLQNWELARFSPPRPRDLKTAAKIVADKNGHLLPDAKRDGNSFGTYRGTWELPDRITRQFVDEYDACLSGRHKFRDFPRDHCICHKEKPHDCDKSEVLGSPDDPKWQKPECQTKCEGFEIVNSWDKPRPPLPPVDKVPRIKKQRSKSEELERQKRRVLQQRTANLMQQKQAQQAKVQERKQKIEEQKEKALAEKQRVKQERAKEREAEKRGI